MKVSITMGVLMLLLASGFIFISYDKADGGVKIMSEDDYKDAETNYGGNINMEYQGPVPEGYDLEHFRKTGETIVEDIN